MRAGSPPGAGRRQTAEEMELSELLVFLTVAGERSFSRAAAKLHRTQPAVSQAIRRLEEELGERLFDRSSKQGEEAEVAVRELRDLRRGRVLVGANEAAVHALLPLIARFRQAHPEIQVVVRRVPSRQVGVEVVQGSLDFGVITFLPAERGLLTLSLGPDDLVMLVHPQHALAGRKDVTLAEFGREVVIAHNDPSPTRERVLRTFEQKHAPINIQVALPSLEAIKRAVEMKMGVALLPKRCALSELSRGTLTAVKVQQVRLARQLRLVYRKGGEMSHAAQAFLEVARKHHPES